LKFNELKAEVLGFGAEFGEGLGATERAVLVVPGRVVTDKAVLDALAELKKRNT